ncbi:MAG: SCO family protein [Bacteroidales bacterium]|nr:SCO family protein [Bacteroidales bacterium]
MRKIFIAAALILSFSSWSQTQRTFDPAKFSEDGKVGIFEHLDEYIPNDIWLTNEDSNQVNLTGLFNKPTVISFVYYTCPGLCSPLLDGIAEVIDRSELVLGKDYQVITISFNPLDGPTLGLKKKANYVKQIKHSFDTTQWMWFTTDSVNIAKITQTAGFRYLQDGKDYVHAAAIIVTSPDGKITRYLHGTYFLPFDLKMAIIEARQGISNPAINKVLKFCFSYDAKGKKYVFNITKITGVLVLSGALAIFLILVLKPKKRKTKTDSL